MKMGRIEWKGSQSLLGVIIIRGVCVCVHFSDCTL